MLARGHGPADLQATAVVGVVLTLATTAGFVYEVAQGHDGTPYSGLCLVASITYLIALVALRVGT